MRLRLGAPARAGVIGVVCLVAIVTAAHAAKFAKKAPHETAPVPATFREADSLVLRAATPERAEAFTAWARRAPLEDLMWVLRRPPSQLGELERPAVEAALDRTPAERRSLHDALAVRLDALPPASGKSNKKGKGEPSAAVSSSIEPPSVYRVALALPTDPGGAEDADAIGAGFQAGLASRAAAGHPPVECVRVSTHGESPAEFAAAIDSAATFAGALCGGTSAGSPVVAAAAARWRGIPLVCLAPTDPQSMRISSRAWGLGPTGAERGRALADALAPAKEDRVALIVSSAADTGFASGFVAACRERGATIVGRVVYAPGNASFTSEIRSLIGQRATLLFWDGDPPEAAALLRQLTRDRVALRVCGGDGLDPGRHHKETRVFLEGVTYALGDWALSAAEQAQLDARLGAAGPSDERHVRGFLAGRLVGAAIATGALTRDELATALGKLAAPGNTGALDVRSQGGALPVFSVQAGEPKRIQ